MPVSKLQLQLQQDASDLFRYREEDWIQLSDYKFNKVLDNDKGMIVVGIDIVNKLRDMREVLCEMMEELDNDNVQYMENEEGKLCKIFDMGKNIIMENRWWLYDYEIEEYCEMIDEKIMEYTVCVKELEEEVQTDKEVYFAISMAILRCS